MSAESFFSKIQSWAGEDSHRGRLVRAFNSNMGNDAGLQAHRMSLLSIYMENEARSARGLSLV
jgi:hypothetical protein